MAYPAAVENALTLSRSDPNYNPADVMRSVGQLSLAKKRWMDEFKAGQQRWQKEFGLKERDLGLREKAFQEELALKNRQLEERIKDAAYQRGFGVLQMGGGTPEERAQFYSQYDLPFTEEAKVKIPGYGYAYGDQGLNYLQSEGGGLSGGVPGSGGSMDALKELTQLQSIMPSYAFSARSRLGPEYQIYSSLQDRAKNLATSLSRASVPGF